MELNDKIIIYTGSDGQTELKVRLEHDTIWLSQAQMSELFSIDRTVIVRHINNIYKTEELSFDSTCAKIAQVRQEGKRIVTREIPFYNLDMIISVGYRVNSKNATAFRRWANRILKDYLVKGYVINNRIASKKYEELCHLVQILGRTVNSQPELTTDESHELINVVSDYTYALDTLDRYDYQQLRVEQTTQEERFHATYDNDC